MSCEVVVKHSNKSCRVTLRNREGNEIILNEYSKRMRGQTYQARARKFAEGLKIVTGANVTEEWDRAA